MAETGSGEMEISPLKSLQKGIKRGIGKLEEIRAHPRRLIAVTGMTAKTKLPAEGGGLQKDVDGEPLNPERTLDERFERGEMFRIMKRIWAKRSVALPEQKGVWSERMRAIREISGNLARSLDTLNNQHYSPEIKLKVELDGEDYQMPVRRYSLGESAAPQDVPPLIILGGASSGHRVTKSTAEAFALQYPGREVYVVGYPDDPAAVIPDSFAEKIKGQEGLDVYTRLLKQTINNLNLPQFDLLGISMGGGIGLGAAKDELFAKKIRNLMLISPTNIEATKGGIPLAIRFGWEGIRGSPLFFHPKEFLRVGQPQPGQKFGWNKGTGFVSAIHIAKEKAFTSEDLAKVREQVNGRFLVITGGKDAVISSKKTLREVGNAGKMSGEEGKKPIESCLVLGGHHNMGDAYAAGLVRLIRETDGSLLPSEYPVSQLENSTAKVLVRSDPRLASVADQIVG